MNPIRVIKAVENASPVKPITDHVLWLKGYTGLIKVDGNWVPYRKVDLADLFKDRTPVLQVPPRAALEDVLDQIHRIYGAKIERRDVQAVRIPVIHKGQSRTIALVAREASAAFCGCVSLRLVNEETQHA